MSEPVLKIEKDAGVAILTLNRPGKMNALSKELRAAIGLAFAELEDDDEIGVVILTGAGRAFTAGLDLKELGSGEATLGGGVNDTVTSDDPVRAMARFPKPIIGAINGVAVTGGFEVALACDVLIASSEARFADTHARVGILPGWGLSQKLSRTIGLYRAKELSLTGNYLSAEQAERWGLVNRVVAPEELLPAAKALAADMLSIEGGTLQAYKALIDEGYAQAFGEAMKTEARVSSDANASVGAADVEARREAVRSRGKDQTAA